MGRPRSIARSIVVSAFVYLVIQCVLLAVSLSTSAALRRPYVWFFPVSAALHAGMVVFLIWRADDFRHTRTREPLPAVNAACHLTLFRLSSVPTIVFLAVGVARGQAPGAALIVISAVAFLSDLLDGQVARRFDQTTDIGRYLDSSTDYAVLVVFAVGLVVLGVTPVWYFAILIARFGGFAIAMLVLSQRKHRIIAETTFLGKASVFGAMTTIVFEICRYNGLKVLGNSTFVLVLEITSAAILASSAVDKTFFLVRKFRAAPQE